MTQWKCFVQTHLLFVTIYGLMWSSLVTFKHKMMLVHPKCVIGYTILRIWPRYHEIKETKSANVCWKAGVDLNLTLCCRCYLLAKTGTGIDTWESKCTKNDISFDLNYMRPVGTEVLSWDKLNEPISLLYLVTTPTKLYLQILWYICLKGNHVAFWFWAINQILWRLQVKCE